MVKHTFDSSTREAEKQVNLCEVKVSKVYVMISRPGKTA